MKAIQDYTKEDYQFYPTPKELAEKMLEGIKWQYVETILEPSAGKGDIVRAIINKNNGRYNVGVEIDCIEIDPNLRAIIDAEEYFQEGNSNCTVRIVYDDFLNFHTFKRYNLIVMNPPFKDGDKHLLKALEIQKNGGSIVCILNAETLKNPYTNTRRELVKQLEKYNASIEYLQDTFSQAERQTKTEIALIKVCIEEENPESDIFNNMKKAYHYQEPETKEITDLEVTDFIKVIINRFNVETAAGVDLIRQYKALKPYINNSFGDSSWDKDSMLVLTDIGGSIHREITVNKYLKMVRQKYWNALMKNPKLTSKLTSKMQERFNNKVYKLKNYDFNEFNIKNIITEINAQIQKGILDEIEVMFDKLTVEHSYYLECSNNKHYYDGWKTNIAHKINNKVIIPCYGIWSTYSSRLDTHRAYATLSDIERVLNFLDGNMTADVNLSRTIEVYFNKGITKNIECKFFKATFYKKGTVHLTFTNTELIDKYNIYIGKTRKWLPPSYGNKKYKDMSQEEKTVINSFQGEKEYNKVLAAKNYYLKLDTPLMIGMSA